MDHALEGCISAEAVPRVHLWVPVRHAPPPETQCGQVTRNFKGNARLHSRLGRIKIDL